ncbi:MAG: sigma-70 family RNA polymerase sigma factor [Planctomycetia bacterium]|nr:sigma-70 family RNA polymerase sigma factor [Planctomycetia bacterium]
MFVAVVGIGCYTGAEGVNHELALVSMTDQASDAAESTSRSLIQRARQQDPEAWQRLSRLYTPLVYGWARQAGLQACDAADVVQEVFRSVFNRVADFRKDRESDSFRGWLWTITRNKIRDHFRRGRMQPQALGGSAARARVAAVPDEEWSTATLPGEDSELELVHRALDLIRLEFESQTWQAFWKAAAEGRTSSDVAEELGISPGAVRQAKYRVLSRLRQELDDRT